MARAAACAALLAVPATGLGVNATVRVEGATDTIVPPTRVALPADGVTVISDTVGGATQSVDARSAAAAFDSVLRARGLAFGWSWSAGLGDIFVTQIGGEVPECLPPSYSPCNYFQLRVNHQPTATGAAQYLADDGVELLFATSDGALDELDVTGPAAPLTPGQRFTVSVERWPAGDAWGGGTGTPTPSPAAGATVRYGSETVTTGSDGTAALTSQGNGWADVTASAAGAIRDRAAVCTYEPSDPTACDLPATQAVQASSAPGTATPALTVPVTIRVGGRDVTVTADVPLPAAGGRPVAIRRQMISGADLTPAEMRRAMGAVASAVAAQLNRRAAQGDADVMLPAGVTWQASWLSGTPYVVPLRRGEALLGAASGGPRNTRAMRNRSGSLQRHLRRCGVAGNLGAVRRHGYALAVLSPASARDALVSCVEGTA